MQINQLNIRNYFIAIMAVIIHLTAGYAQKLPDMIPYRKGAKWGYVDKDKNTIIPFQYDRAAPFSEGLAAVRLGNKEGYIDEAGELALDTAYIEAGDFENGYAIVGFPWRFYTYEVEYDEEDENEEEIEEEYYPSSRTYQSATGDPPRYGVIDKNGKEVLPLKYTDIYQMEGYFILGVDSKDLYNVYSEGEIESIYGLATLQGDVLIPPTYRMIQIAQEGILRCQTIEGKEGWTDIRNEILVPFQYDYTILLNPTSGIYLGVTDLWAGSDKKWYLLEENGASKELNYENVRSPSEGLALVQRTGKWGFIDENGKEIIPPIYHEAGDFGEGLAPVKTDEGWVYINKKNKIQLETNYGHCRTFLSGLAAVQEDELWGFIDRNGKEVIPLKYRSAWNFQKEFAIVTKSTSGKYQMVLIDRQGKELTSLAYLSMSSFKNGLAKVELTGDLGFQYSYNNESYDYYKYQDASTTGYIDELGNIYFEE